MPTARIDETAALLIEARTSGVALDSLPEELLPADSSQAQLVDDRVAELSGWEVLGWKIGCTSEAAQKLLGSSRPFAGRVYAISNSGAELGPAELLSDAQVEGEFAVTLGADVTPSAAPERAAVVDAVADVHPAIEVVGGRYTDFLAVPLVCLIADAGANSHLILGPAAKGFDLDQLRATPGTMTIDGTVTGSGTGADVLGDPVDALLWLVADLAERGFALTAGQVVSTGTLTQVSVLPPGSTAAASFGGLGEVTVRRSP